MTILSDGNGLDSVQLQQLLTARCKEKDQEYDFINYTMQSSDISIYMFNRFDYQQVYPPLKQQTIICYILATLFCVEMLKQNGKEFKKYIENDHHVLPLSVLRYSQNDGDDLNNHHSTGYMIAAKTEDPKKQQKYINNIDNSTIKNKDGTTMNVFAMKKLFKFLKKHWKQIEGYEKIIKGVIEGTLTNEDRKYFKSDVSFVKELFKYDLKHNGIIERKSWLDKALSSGENNARNRRINQLAKIMNYEFTRNIVDDEAGTRANKKEIFKSKPKREREMKEITFDDLLSISNIHKTCGCTSEPNVTE